ncbi:MAG: N-acetyl-gamma-glutamyl-phosphate reductase [Nitrospirae bacterium]|nr:N-acetyl-gamma-glutamyl-phosphate reductase [Nitrospirota bacterium]
MLKVAIAGGSGYTGGELLRLLLQHPHVKVTLVTAERSAGKAVTELFPGLRKIADHLTFEPMDFKKAVNRADLFFLCLPHKTSQEIVFNLHKAGKKVIDLSADYRLKEPSVYEEWYNTPHFYPALLKKSVYGLPELYRKEIKKAKIVANPGCYPVSAILGLAPLLSQKAEVIDTDSIIIDSKSGVSGAGRNPSQPFMFCEANESVRAYAITTHRHTPEIEQELSSAAKKKIQITFTPHLMPMDRGILSTIYVKLKKDSRFKIQDSRLHKIYQKFYAKEPFVRVLKEGEYPNTKAVKGTNFCDIAVFPNTRKNSLIIVTAIDNLLKGAAGAAVHNMNIMYGFDETEGLKPFAPFP